MPRRKKATASPAEPEEAPPSKRSRGDGDGVSPDDRVLRWQWEDDGGKWKTYSQQFEDLLSEGFRGDAKPVTLSVSAKVTMKVDFDKMVQKNRVTGWERRVRLAVSDKGQDDFRVWEFEDDRSHWCPYSAAHTLSLEGATEAGDETIALTGPRHSYTVDLTSKTQTNDSTGASRSVRSDDVDIDTPSDDVIPQPEVTPAAKSTGAAPSTSGRGASKSAASAKGASGRATSNGAAKSGRKSAGGDTVRTLVMKGAAPVDPECTAKVNTAHVYSRGKDVYDAMLNQTNLSNNNNKYYLMQVLEDDARKAYSVWFRWGRVGYNGQTTLIPCGPDVDDAIHTFTKKFQDKTKNAWSERSKFQKVAGKYDLVKMDYSTESVKKEDNPKKPENVPDSKLEKRLQSLINLICDVKRMEDAVIEMKYDAKKAPLGKLTPNQIKAGYAALKKIDTYIEKSDLGSKLVQACDEFYTRIPHDFGMRTPPVIRTKADVKLKLNLLEALSDIEIAMNIIKESNIDENPVDTHYNSLKCGMTAMDKTCGDYKMIEDYLKNTHAKTHNQYSMSILDVFNVEKDSETKGFKDKGNRMLLWHGSRLTNWVGILSQGLRIAPPEAPVTGYMFGKGVYFADMSSKSANYCYPSQAKTEGLLLLCEVSLGSCNELLSADYKADQLPAGKHSVYGKGSTAPDAKKNFTMSNGCVVPLGKSVDTGVKNPNGYTLNYNEFIVYNLNQIKMKYLIRVKFNFK